MLKIISPKGHKLHQSSIEAFLSLLSVYQNFELSEKRMKNATFIIAEDTQHGVYGGAVLYPQKIYGRSEDEFLEEYEDCFQGLFMTFHPHIQEFWMARVCFCLDANLSSGSFSELELCIKFYNEIYEAMLTFGQSKGIIFLPYSLCSFDTIEPPLYKDWPYNVPFRDSKDTSGLSHGILSLTGERFLPKLSRKRSQKQTGDHI